MVKIKVDSSEFGFILIAYVKEAEQTLTLQKEPKTWLQDEPNCKIYSQYHEVKKSRRLLDVN